MPIGPRRAAERRIDAAPSARAWSRALLGAAALFGGAVGARSARAEPLRLRGDALATTQSPVGLLVLEGEDHARPWLHIEGLVWAGIERDQPGAPASYAREPAGNVLVLSARLRTPDGRGELRLGRFVETTGAVRPVQIDGASAIARAPSGTTLEGFGGVPVVSSIGDRSYDWVAGARLSQSIGSRAVVGGSYVQERDHGELAYHEVGADASALPARWLDLSAKLAYDIDDPGITDAKVSSAVPLRACRFEMFGARRSPARLLPATSLFSVLGDVPSTTAGATASFRAAPRLELVSSLAAQSVGGESGVRAFVRTTLELDDDGRGRLGVELRREGTGDASWAGVRAVLAGPLGGGFGASTELELVRTRNRLGDAGLYPWGLLALSWYASRSWQVAGALESASTPRYRYELNALARISYLLGATR